MNGSESRGFHRRRNVLLRIVFTGVVFLALADAARAQEAPRPWQPPYDLSGAGTGSLLRSLEAGLTSEERLSAAWFLGRLDASADRQAALQPLFEAFLHDGDDTVRRFAGEALARYAALREPPNFEAARRAHFDALAAMVLPPVDVNLRVQAMEILGAMRDSRATPLLLERMEDYLPVVRMAAARAVARLGDMSALKPLRERKNSASPRSEERAVYEEAYQELIRRVELTTQAIHAKRAGKSSKRVKKTVVVNPPEP